MKRVMVGVIFCGLLGSGLAVAEPAAGGVKEQNCAEMFKAVLPLPTKFGELMTSVSDGMMAHAKWVGQGKDAASKAEAATLTKVAQDHAAVATQMKKIVADMEAGTKLKAAPHDMSKADPKAGEMMLKQAALEREMAAMMIKHAEQTEKTVQEMSKGAPHAAK